MTILAIESFTACIPDIKTLIDGHYQELALNKDKVPLDPRWDVYETAEKLGSLHFVSVREDNTNKLVGYAIGFIEPELHYRTTLGYSMDIMYVHPEHRGEGLGNKLMSYLELDLKARGVQRLFLGSKCHKDIGALFLRHKFKLVEMYYSKWIGE